MKKLIELCTIDVAFANRVAQSVYTVNIWNVYTEGVAPFSNLLAGEATHFYWKYQIADE